MFLVALDLNFTSYKNNKTMKHFKIATFGEIPKDIQTLVNNYNNPDVIVDKYTINCLEKDMEFLICDLKVAHGNLNRSSKDAWLSPINNDQSFNVKINF